MSNFEKLQGRLAAGETILMDGGMGSELERRGLASPTSWSGGPMLTHPELVRDIHQEYKWVEANTELPERYLEDSGYQGRPRYQHILRSYASVMVKNRELERVRRGRFRIPCAQ